MANNGNKIVDSDTNCSEHTDRFVYYNNPNATNKGSLAENHKFFHKLFKYVIQSKKKIFNAKKKRSSTPCKSEEKIATCTSSSLIVDKIIKSDTKVVAKIKQRMHDAITSTARSDEVYDKVAHENLSGVGHLVRGASYRYAQYAAKYVDNAVPEHGCGPLCINIGTQSNTVDGEFSLRTSSDTFAKACEARRHADFILKEIAKVSDVLTERAHLVSAKKTASILAFESATSTGYKMGEETFANTKPSISSIIRAEKIPTVAAATMTVMQPETLTDTRVLVPSSSQFAPDSRSFSACLDESLDTSNMQVISSVKYLQHTHSVSCMYPERHYFRDIAVTTVAREKKKEEEQLWKKIPMLDKHMFATDKTDYAVINSMIVNCILMRLRKKCSRSSGSYQPSIQTDDSKRKRTKKGSVDSSTQISRIKSYQPRGIQTRDSKRKIDISTQIPRMKKPTKKPTPKPTPKPTKRPTQKPKQIAVQDSFMTCSRESCVSCRDKKPKYRAKYRIDGKISDGDKTKEKKVSVKCKRPPKPEGSPFFPPLAIETAKSFHCLKRPTEMYQDCQSKLLKCQQSIRHCEDLVSSNVCLGRPSYCDIWTTPCFSSQNCYPRLSNIDNVRMGNYHCNDSYPVWNNNQHCGRDQSYCWTKGNLYFTQPWRSEHLL